MLPPCRPAAYVIMISFNQLISKAFKPFKKCFYIFIMSFENVETFFNVHIKEH